MIRWFAAFLLMSLATALAENWPCFRGPSRQGVSGETHLPLSWDDKTHIKWKTAIPGAGWSSPIIWQDRVFVTAATADGTSCHVLCLDAASGGVLWDVEVFQQEVLRKEERNSYATPTPVTDGKSVYAVFGSGSIAALNFDGTVKWTFREWTFYSRHGLGASPVLEDGLLIVPWDWSQNPKDGPERVGWQIPWDKSYVFALNKDTGKLAWKTGRGTSRIAHVTPNVFTDETGRKQLVSGAGDVVQGFELKTGKLLWTGENKGEGVVPSIVLGDGLVFAANGFGGFDSVRAYRLKDAAGDISSTHLAWEQKKNAPKIPSLLYLSPQLYAVTEGGIAICLDGSNGEFVWRERLGGTFSGSPVAAEGRIYAVADNGETIVLAAGQEFKILSRNPIGEKVQASPAISNGRIFIRGEKRLFCIGP
ncbi:MAG: PQQ-binding-like beta-propeller repeat protein [Verrucomicrobiales bacterium]